MCNRCCVYRTDQHSEITVDECLLDTGWELINPGRVAWVRASEVENPKNPVTPGTPIFFKAKGEIMVK